MPKIIDMDALKIREDSARSMEPSKTLRKEWDQKSCEVIQDFFTNLADIPTFQNDTNFQPTDLGNPLGEKSDFDTCLKNLAKTFSSAGIQTAGAGHLGFIPGGGLHVAALADYLAASFNHFSADSFASPAAVAIHNQVIAWLCKTVGYSENAAGDITSGGTHATLEAFTTARHSLDVKAKDFSKFVVYASAHTHHCYRKVLDIVFGGEASIHLIPCKDARMDPEALLEQIKTDIYEGLRPGIVISSAGTTNLGVIDPIEKIADVAQEFDLWLHVDGAYGGFFSMTEIAKDKFRGLSRADSIILDPHKGMFLPYGAGAVLIKDAYKMQASFGEMNFADYLQDRSHSISDLSPMDYTLELTRPFRSLRLWLALKVHGEDSYKLALEEKLLLAQYAADRISNIEGLSLVNRPELSVFAFKCDEDPTGNKTQELLKKLNLSGEVFLSSTKVEDVFVIRVAILSHRTHKDKIDQLISLLERFTTGEGHE